jgi:hypothetical protein
MCQEGKATSLILAWTGILPLESALGPSPITASHAGVQRVRRIAAEGEG